MGFSFAISTAVRPQSVLQNRVITRKNTHTMRSPCTHPAAAPAVRFNRLSTGRLKMLSRAATANRRIRDTTKNVTRKDRLLTIIWAMEAER